MPLEGLSHFDERTGIVPCLTPWGMWWQTVNEINIEVNIPVGTRGRDVKVKLASNEIECIVRNELLFKGKLFGTVRNDELVWTIEDGNIVSIVLSKTPQIRKDEIWEGLLKENYMADPYTLHEMRKKLDLEWFQIENPGFDFSNAKLSKLYDRIPGLKSAKKDVETTTKQPSETPQDDKKGDNWL